VTKNSWKAIDRNIDDVGITGANGPRNVPSIRDGPNISYLNMKTFFQAATERKTAVTAVKVALVVGTVLALINYGDRIFLRGDMRVGDWLKLAVTYAVPYCVAAYGAAKYAVTHDNDEP
jgi:hypothetical protein